MVNTIRVIKTLNVPNHSTKITFRTPHGHEAFVGSANLTGAGLGAKHQDKRNFEAGFWFDSAQDITQLAQWIDSLYVGEHCESCKRREHCTDPIVDLF